jgi:hypothetical protein
MSNTLEMPDTTAAEASAPLGRLFQLGSGTWGGCSTSRAPAPFSTETHDGPL